MRKKKLTLAPVAEMETLVPDRTIENVRKELREYRATLDYLTTQQKKVQRQMRKQPVVVMIPVGDNNGTMHNKMKPNPLLKVLNQVEQSIDRITRAIKRHEAEEKSFFDKNAGKNVVADAMDFLDD